MPDFLLPDPINPSFSFCNKKPRPHRLTKAAACCADLPVYCNHALPFHTWACSGQAGRGGQSLLLCVRHHGGTTAGAAQRARQAAAASRAPCAPHPPLLPPWLTSLVPAQPHHSPTAPSPASQHTRMASPLPHTASQTSELRCNGALRRYAPYMQQCAMQGRGADNPAATSALPTAIRPPRPSTVPLQLRK